MTLVLFVLAHSHLCHSIGVLFRSLLAQLFITNVHNDASMRGRSLVLSLVLLALMLLSELAHASTTTTSRDVPAAAPLKTIVMSRDITTETRREQRRLLFAQGGDGGGGYALPRSLSGGGGGTSLRLSTLTRHSIFVELT